MHACYVTSPLLGLLFASVASGPSLLALDRLLRRACLPGSDVVFTPRCEQAWTLSTCYLFTSRTSLAVGVDAGFLREEKQTRLH